MQGARASIITDVIEAEIDANGGDIRKLVLSRYRQNEAGRSAVRLLEEKPAEIISPRWVLSAALADA
jgi:hypothetical protein